MYEKVKKNVEILSKKDGFYHFSSYLKLEDIIISRIMKKYDKDEKYFDKKVYKSKYYQIPKEETYWKDELILARFIIKSKFNIKKHDITITKTRIFNLLNTKEYIYIKDLIIDENMNIKLKKDIYKYNYEQFEDRTYETRSLLENNMIYTNIPFITIKLIKELIILNNKVNVNINVNPMFSSLEVEKEKYIKSLIYFLFTKNHLTAEQICRIEQISRQLNISSKDILNFINEVLNYDLDKDMNEIYFDSIPKNYHDILSIDMLVIDKLGKNDKDTKKYIIKVIDVSQKKLNIIDEFVENKIKKVIYMGG
ncbi:MAG: hypothetical protein R3Y64_10785 [Peptostreptococcaceae bacterium]